MTKFKLNTDYIMYRPNYNILVLLRYTDMHPYYKTQIRPTHWMRYSNTEWISYEIIDEVFEPKFFNLEYIGEL